jgi:hypothetical protein
MNMNNVNGNKTGHFSHCVELYITNKKQPYMYPALSQASEVLKYLASICEDKIKIKLLDEFKLKNKKFIYLN